MRDAGSTNGVFVDGTLVTDGINVYDLVARVEGVTRAGCWSHARRKFFEARDAAPHVAAGALAVAYTAGSDVAKVTWSALPNSVLDDGNYTATISGIYDPAGNAATAPTSNFFFLQGDATQDRFVDTQDFNI